MGTAGIEQEIQVDLQDMFWLESHQLARSEFQTFITHALVHINDFMGVRARYVKRTG